MTNRKSEKALFAERLGFPRDFISREYLILKLRLHTLFRPDS